MWFIFINLDGNRTANNREGYFLNLKNLDFERFQRSHNWTNCMHTVWRKFNWVFISIFIVASRLELSTIALLGKMKTHCSRLSLDWTIYISVLLGKWPNIECNSDIMWRYFNRKCFLGSRCSRSTTSCWLFAKIHCSCGCVISDSTLSMGILRRRDSKGNIDLTNSN